MTVRRFSEMTDSERDAWGDSEANFRMVDLSDRTAEGLRMAQANAERRRNAVGASRVGAAEAVSTALRNRRIAESRQRK